MKTHSQSTICQNRDAKFTSSANLVTFTSWQRKKKKKLCHDLNIIFNPVEIKTKPKGDTLHEDHIIKDKIIYICYILENIDYNFTENTFVCI